MNLFLEETKNVFQNLILNPTHYKKVSVVLGNESCDLDSAICSLVYGFTLHHEGIQDYHSKTAVLPLLNIPQDDLPLKTEVTFFLEQNGICLDNVSTRGFRNLFDLKKIHDAGCLELILVDHHALNSTDAALASAVVEVIDHRPRDPAWSWENVKNVTIEPVGSCATLVARRLMEKDPHLLTREISKLLMGPIVLDTVNLSESAGRSTPEDARVLQYLETIVTMDRSLTFQDLLRAKADIASLTTSQVLRKDMKILAGVPIPGAPTLIDHLRTRPDFTEAVEELIKQKSATLVVLIGVLISGDAVSRDIAVFGESSKLQESVIKTLLAESSLQLQEVSDHGVHKMRLFRQGNIKATRKHIVPIIAKVLAQHAS